MRHRAVWISFWMTMMYWLGGAFGCSSYERNVARLESPATIAPAAHPVSDTEPSIQGLDRSSWPTVSVEPVGGWAPHGTVVFKDVPIRGYASPSQQPPSNEVPLDLNVVKLPAEEFSRVRYNAMMNERNLIAAMSGQQAGNWNARNRWHFIMQPVKVPVDLVSVPFRPTEGVQDDAQ